jgi:hypothetical protein
VPVAYAHHEVQVLGYVGEVMIGVGTEVVARHRRSYEKAGMIFDPLHFLPLLERKIAAMDHVHGAVRQALDLGAIGYDAVKHLVLCRIERRPPRLDLDIYPYLPRARAETTTPSSDLSLG